MITRENAFWVLTSLSLIDIVHRSFTPTQCFLVYRYSCGQSHHAVSFIVKVFWRDQITLLCKGYTRPRISHWKHVGFGTHLHFVWKYFRNWRVFLKDGLDVWPSWLSMPRAGLSTVIVTRQRGGLAHDLRPCPMINMIVQWSGTRYRAIVQRPSLTIRSWIHHLLVSGGRQWEYPLIAFDGPKLLRQESWTSLYQKQMVQMFQWTDL